MSLLKADVSTAFMYAPVEADACDLVLLPAITVKGQRVILWLKKVKNGLRRAPLLWFLELQRTIRDLGGDETFESTLFHVQTDTQFLLVLCDDLLIAMRNVQKIWKIKRTGSIPSGQKGLLEFSGRTIPRCQGVSALWSVSKLHGGDLRVMGREAQRIHGSAVPKL